MRIISGTAGGRKLLVPEGRDVRPTSDKVRGAIFNSLRSKMNIEGAAVIDAFCGSGALGLEALSRGANSCAFIADNRDALFFTKKNAAALGFEKNCVFLLKNMRKLKNRFENAAPASLVFLDPPYNKKLILPALAALHDGEWLAPNATVILETEKNFKEILPPPFVIFDEKTYGDTKVYFCRLGS